MCGVAEGGSVAGSVGEDSDGGAEEGDGWKTMSMEFLSKLTLESSKMMPATSIAKSSIPKAEKVNLKELVEFIRCTEEYWLTEPEIRKNTTEQEWNDFRRRLYIYFDYTE